MLKLSYSSFKRYNNCPAFYRINLTQPKPQMAESAFIGTTIQAIFEHMVRNGYPTLEQLLKKMPEITESVATQNKIASTKEHFDVIKSGVTVSYPAFENFKTCGMESEVTLQTIMDDTILEGRLDFISKAGNFLFDGKATQHREKYVDFDQLTFYSFLYLRNFGRIPKAAFLWYFFGDFQEVYQSQKRLADLRDRIRGVIEKIKKEEFSVRNKGWHCRDCSEQSTCPAYLYNQREGLKIGGDKSIEVVEL